MTLGGDHVGPSFEHRFPQALKWLDRSMDKKGGAINMTLEDKRQQMNQKMTNEKKQYMEWVWDKQIMKKQGVSEEPPKGSEEVNIFMSEEGVEFLKSKMKGDMKNYINKPFEGFDRMKICISPCTDKGGRPVI